VKSFLIAAVVGYVALVGLLFVFQRSLVFMPPREPPGTPAMAGVAEMRAIEVETKDGLRLLSWFAPPAVVGKPVIVQFHGNASMLAYRAGVARLFLDAGYGVLLVGYRGYNGNPGQPTEAGLYADARTNLDWLAVNGFAGQQIVLNGESLGTGVAVQMAIERQVGAVVLEAPYSRLTAAAAVHYPYVPVALLMKDKFDSIDKISQVEAPLLVVMGELDKVIPVAQGRALFAAKSGDKQAAWLPEAGHNDLYAHGAWEAISAFLEARFSASTSEATPPQS